MSASTASGLPSIDAAEPCPEANEPPDCLPRVRPESPPFFVFGSRGAALVRGRVANINPCSPGRVGRMAGCQGVLAPPPAAAYRSVFPSDYLLTFLPLCEVPRSLSHPFSGSPCRVTFLSWFFPTTPSSSRSVVAGPPVPGRVALPLHTAVTASMLWPGHWGVQPSRNGQSRRT